MYAYFAWGSNIYVSELIQPRYDWTILSLSIAESRGMARVAYLRISTVHTYPVYIYSVLHSQQGYMSIQRHNWDSNYTVLSQQPITMQELC